MSISIYSKRVLLPGGLTEATVFIDNGKISAIEKGKIEKDGYQLDDCGSSVIMPGLIDSHVHINEPGRTEWEGFNTATQAAAAGGITTLVDMPLNSSPVSINGKAFRQKLDASNGKLHVNCGFWGGLVPENIDDLDELLNAGVLGIKAFLTHSGIDEFPNVTEADLRKAIPILKKHDALLLVHCELDSPHADQQLLENSPTSYKAYLASRPKEWEDKAIALMIKLCEEYKVRTHIVHLSSANSIEQLKTAKAKGLPISVETCTHYLYFNAEDIRDGATEYKCAPPIREKENNEQLWQALKDGLIEFVVTDHSPAPPELKELESGNFKKAWGGIAGLQFSLPAFWTQAKERNFSIENVADLMSLNVAKF
ncbi:MAG: allantoinase AllB [Flavobacteriales bacterium]|nr:allantoinase AllB [Flavobacteriales bacterium]